MDLPLIFQPKIIEVSSSCQAATEKLFEALMYSELPKAKNARKRNYPSATPARNEMEDKLDAHQAIAAAPAN